MNWTGPPAPCVVHEMLKSIRLSTFRCRFGGILPQPRQQSFASGLVRYSQSASKSTRFGVSRVWQTACNEWGMLRITLSSASHSGFFILKGRLSGLWAKELLRVARGTNQGYGNIFDLQEVFFVDSAGQKALQLLGGRGARFITESAYGKDLCSRLKLQRVATFEVEKNKGNRLEGSYKPKQPLAAHGALTADRSSRGE